GFLHSTPPRYPSFRRALSLFYTKPPSLSFSDELSSPAGPLCAGVVVCVRWSVFGDCFPAGVVVRREYGGFVWSWCCGGEFRWSRGGGWRSWVAVVVFEFL
ncbi:hypothetical protein A2U01_0068606, partial [Trifolium medium]|nr:hypothetical protein [Trifolium medium]